MKINDRWSLRVFLLSILVLLLISSTGGSLGYAAPVQDEPYIFTVPMDEALLVIDDELLSASFMGTNKNSKLDSSLGQLTSSSDRSAGEFAAQAESLGARLSNDLVQVQIATSAADLDAAVRAVTASGGQVTGTALDKAALQAWLPVDSLESIIANDSVYFVRLPMYTELMGDMRVGDSDTEALSIMNVDAWHAAGIQGDGVKVAIIDGGFIGYEGLLGTDLPASVTPKNFVDFEADPGDVGTGTEHGTACAEIVHDIAPEAELFLLKIGTNLDLEEAALYAIAQGVDIISTSLGFYNLTPGDGTGEFEDLVALARSQGILWLTAASNDRRAHWGGLYYDPDGDGVINLTDTAELNPFAANEGSVYILPAGVAIRIFVRWDDWTDVDQDFDIFLYRGVYSEGTLYPWTSVASGRNTQDGSAGQTPTEFISYITTSPQAAYAFYIRRESGSEENINFEVFAPKVTSLRYMVYERSLANLADAPSVLTVAALDVTSPYPQEDYSSEGPTNGPGGSLTGGSIKPDISGFANVSTESYGDGIFNGTSSATPHVAGAAALVLCANPTYTPDDIQDYLEGHAVDMGAAGKDTIFGYGRVRLSSPSSADEILNFLPLLLR
ncbi:MAG: S8 family serine peptidase [Anaerolineaceae bacterium]|nr:S8 family serine peptidase [Anaerolineaceae bacterium]